jgi:hypothetical protein
MTRVVVHFQSPDLPENSFAAQPKTFYRAGTGYCRVEEALDSENGIHGLMVINEPDSWMVNLLTKSGQHMVDPGPTFNCKLLVFTDDIKSATDATNKLNHLEFGREIAFFQENGATVHEGPTLHGKATKAYVVDAGNSKVMLFTDVTQDRPIAVARERGDKREVYWYATYEELPFDSKLFMKPDGAKIEDRK